MLHLKANRKEVLPAPDEHSGRQAPGNDLFFPPKSEAILQVTTRGQPSLSCSVLVPGNRARDESLQRAQAAVLSFSGEQTTARCFDGHTRPWAPLLLGSACHILGDSQAQVPRAEVSPPGRQEHKSASVSHSQRRGKLDSSFFP